MGVSSPNLRKIGNVYSECVRRITLWTDLISKSYGVTYFEYNLKAISGIMSYENPPEAMKILSAGFALVAPCR